MHRALVFFTLMTALLPGTASAINNTLQTALPAGLGEVRTQAVTNGDVAYFSYFLKAGRSYVAVCWSPSAEGTAIGNGVINRCTVQIRDIADSAVGVAVGFSGGRFAEPTFPGGNTVTYTPSAQNVHFVRVDALVTGSLRVLMLETTLFAPWWYVSPIGSYEAYVEVRNNTDFAIAATVTAFSNLGVSLGTVTKTIQANGNDVVAVGSQFGVPAGFGSIQVSHTGGFGGVSANVTVLGVATGLSFDAPATPRMAYSVFQ